MPRFKYTAKSQPHQFIHGIIEAESPSDAVAKINNMGYFPISITFEDVSLGHTGILNINKVSRKDVALFTRQLSSLIDSGINIVNALNTLKQQTPNSYFKRALSDITDKIREGKSFSDALASYPELFSRYYSATIRSGEGSGSLDLVLRRLADFLEREEEFRSSLRNSLAYPLFVFIVGALTIFVLLTFVVPRLIVMFEDMGQFLPMPTRILIGIANFMHAYWWLLLAIAILSVFLLNRAMHTSQGKVRWDRFKLRIPLFGNINFKTEAARLTRTVSLLISSGLPITSSLDIAASVIDNEILKSEMRRFKEDINSGSSLSQSLSKSEIFPEFVTSIVAIGEESGALEKSFLRIAQDYEREVDSSLKTLVRLSEPIIILVMGLVVGFIVLAMLLPIFQINLIVK